MLEWIAFGFPFVPATFERVDVGDAEFSEFERHPGARGFVGSSAIEHDAAIARNLHLAGAKLAGFHAQRAGKRARIGEGVERVAQVDDRDGASAVEHCLEFVGSDAIFCEGSQEASAVLVLLNDISRESEPEKDDQPDSKTTEIERDELELTAEKPAHANETPRPEEHAGRVEK